MEGKGTPCFVVHSFLVLGGHVSCQPVLEICLARPLEARRYSSIRVYSSSYDDKSASRGSAYLLSPSTPHDGVLIGSVLLHEDSQGCRHAAGRVARWTAISAQALDQVETLAIHTFRTVKKVVRLVSCMAYVVHDFV